MYLSCDKHHIKHQVFNDEYNRMRPITSYNNHNVGHQIFKYPTMGVYDMIN